MSVGQDTFIADILYRCGWTNVFGHLGRYPEITIEALQAAQPDVILLSSEPFPFKEKHMAELQAQLPAAKIVLVDGEMFSWYGSRLLHAVSYLQNLVNQRF
jgi:ABC-type Fe3+-hydroxamate transport system substrate-binding protein